MLYEDNSVSKKDDMNMLGQCFLIYHCIFSGKSNFQSLKKEFRFSSFSSKITKLQCFLAN